MSESINDLRCPDCGALAEDIDGEIADCACGRAWEIDPAETYHPVLLAALATAEAERDRLREELGLRFHDAVSPTEDEAIDLLSEELAASQADAERLAVVTDLLVRDSQCACLDDSGGCNRCMGLAALALHRSLAAPRPESEAEAPPVEVGQVRRSPSGEEWTIVEVGRPREPWIALSMPPRGKRGGVARSQSLSVVATWPLVPAPPAEEE